MSSVSTTNACSDYLGKRLLRVVHHKTSQLYGAVALATVLRLSQLDQSGPEPHLHVQNLRSSLCRIAEP